MTNPNPSLFVFDLDGTLVDTMHGFADIAAAVISERHGWAKEKARSGYMETCGIPFFQQLEVLFPGDSKNAVSADEFEQRKARYFYGATMRGDDREALALLKESGCRLAVSSNNFEALVKGMIRREAPDAFDVVLGYQEGFAKGPAHFAHIFSKLGVAAASTVFVGDSLSDLDKAAAAGTDFVAVTGTFGRDRFVEKDPLVKTVKAISELPALFAISRASARGAQ